MSDLRDFLYLDIPKLHSFVSQIQGGLISEVSEKIKQLGGLSAGLNVGIVPFSGKIDTSKGKESERQHTIQFTDPVYFDVVYRHLSNEQRLTDITASSLQTRDKLFIGQFVEIRGVAEPPVVESWIERFTTLFTFVDKNSKSLAAIQPQGKGRTAPTLSTQQLKQFKAIEDLLVDFINMSRKDPGKQYIRVTADKQPYKAWCGLVPDFVAVPLQSTFPTEVHILGRVDRLLNEGETWKIVDLAMFNQSAQANQLLTMLNGFNALTGQKPLSENDSQVQYPDIFISPIAIYR